MNNDLKKEKESIVYLSISNFLKYVVKVIGNY